MIHTPFGIMTLFFHKVSVIFNALLPTLSKTLYVQIWSTSQNSVSVCCHVQNGVHAAQRLHAQTGVSQRAPDVGCKQDGEEQSVPFLRLPDVRLGIVVKEKDVFHVSVMTNCTEVLSQFV
jgi:hypothetical protein